MVISICKDDVALMVEQLLILTDKMLSIAEQADWAEFEPCVREREVVCDKLQQTVGDQLLQWLPDYQDRLILAQQHNQRIDALLMRRRMTLMDESKVNRKQHKLIQAYTY